MWTKYHIFFYFFFHFFDQFVEWCRQCVCICFAVPEFILWPFLFVFSKLDRVWVQVYWNIIKVWKMYMLVENCPSQINISSAFRNVRATFTKIFSIWIWNTFSNLHKKKKRQFLELDIWIVFYLHRWLWVHRHNLHTQQPNKAATNYCKQSWKCNQCWQVWMVKLQI